MMRPGVIFLDLDGVLITRRSFGTRRFDSEALENLDWLLTNSGAGLVVTSTWRIGHRSPRSLEAMLRPFGLTAPLLGMTPDLARRTGSLYEPGQRHAEIEAWLRERTASWPPFVILDDEDFDLGRLAPLFLVRTNFEVGLTREDAARALGILASPTRRGAG